MITYSALVGFDIEKDTTGVVTLPTWCDFADGTDYRVVVVEGDATVDYGSQTATQFEVTLGGGDPAVFKVIPKKPRVFAHID